MQKIFSILVYATLALAVAPFAFAGPYDLRFSQACRPAKGSVTIGFGGDLMMHMPLQVQAANSANGYSNLWPDMEPVFRKLGLAYLNLETPVFGKKGASGYPHFNAAKSLPADLVQSGVDLVSTANNHALDQGVAGADATIDALNGAGLKFFGTRKSDGTGKWYTTAKVGALNLAFVACTYGTNGIPDPKSQVMKCYNGSEQPSSTLLELVRQLSADPSVSAVIVTPHWGSEETNKPKSAQTSLARALVDAGALAVVGTHPHVVQPWETQTNSAGQDALVVYSTGNIITNRKEPMLRTSVFVVLGISYDNSGVWINGARYIPLYVDRTPKFAVKPLELLDAKERAIPEQIVGKYFGTSNRLLLSEKLLTNPDCF